MFQFDFAVFMSHFCNSILGQLLTSICGYEICTFNRHQTAPNISSSLFPICSPPQFTVFIEIFIHLKGS